MMIINDWRFTELQQTRVKQKGTFSKSKEKSKTRLARWLINDMWQDTRESYYDAAADPYLITATWCSTPSTTWCPAPHTHTLIHTTLYTHARTDLPWFVCVCVSLLHTYNPAFCPSIQVIIYAFEISNAIRIYFLWLICFVSLILLLKNCFMGSFRTQINPPSSCTLLFWILPWFQRTVVC